MRSYFGPGAMGEFWFHEEQMLRVFDEAYEDDRTGRVSLQMDVLQEEFCNGRIP